MRVVVALDVAGVVPDREAVLRGLGPAGPERPSRNTEALLQRAVERFAALAAPAGIHGELSVADFAAVYPGEGNNEPHTPLGVIYPQASALALYAATVGEPVSQEISSLFGGQDFALAVVLDAVASAGALLAERRVQESFHHRLATRGLLGAGDRLVNYSPGYCGWNITGQRTLFRALRPEEIGIRLNESCLMQPLKSVSGVIVAGPAAIHRFEDGYPFCADCRDRECRARIEGLAG